MSPEGELSTEDLARSGEVRQEKRPTSESRREQAPAASEMPAVRPRVDEDDASPQGGQPPVMPQEADPRYEQGTEAGDPREGGSTAAAQRAGRPGGPGSVPDSLGGGHQGSMTQPGNPEEAASPARSSEPGAAMGGESSAGTDGGGRPPGDGSTDGDGGEVALLGSTDEDRFRQRWDDAQARFVDDPQEAVRSADGLVAELMQSLAQGFSEHKERLETQWQRGGDPDTEDLRQAMQRYRSFFNRLLST
jgi:hypothetical protein